MSRSPYTREGALLVTGEDVESNQMNFSVAVLPSLGGGHLHDLGGAVLQEKQSVKNQLKLAGDCTL